MILKQIFRRGALIFLAGLLLNGFPFFTWPPALEGASFIERVVDHLEHWRIMGVLQRIGLAYLGGALLTRRTSPKQQPAILTMLLFGYWALMTLVPVPDTGVPGRLVLDKPDQLLSAWVDRKVLGVDHLWSGSVTWDPEGLLSTLPAIGTMICGAFAGRWMARRDLQLNARLVPMYAVGSLAMMVGLMWNWIFPFVVYGINPMLVFLGSGVMARCIYSIWTWEAGVGGRISAQEVVFNTVYA